MNKDNVFKSSRFYMDNGDVLHVILKDFTGDSLTITLNSGSTDEIEDASIIESEDAIYNLIDKDGNLYTVVTIGNQQWTVQSLKTETYADGTAIPEIQNAVAWAADETGAHCYYDNDSATYKATYGALYNWYAMTNSHGLVYFERGGIPATGWRVPTYTDLNILLDYIFSYAEIETYLLAGGHLKETGLTHWAATDAFTYNTFGFTALGSGFRASTGTFTNVLAENRIGSITGYKEALGSVWGYCGRMISGDPRFQIMLSQRAVGYSIRCVRDIVANILRDIDGNEYTTITIGNQEWTVENLRVTRYSDGTSIHEYDNDALWIADTTGAFCWYDNDLPSYGDAYGALYNFYAVDNDSGLVYFEKNGVQEEGWRVPTKGDYETLMAYTGGATLSGGRLKETGTTYWTTPNTGATNDYGFKARGSGHRDAAGAYDFITELFYAWTSTESGAYTYRFGASYNSAEATVTEMDGADKILGYAVRCVRDV